MTDGEKLQQALEKDERTQKAIADQLGISRVWLHQLKHQDYINAKMKDQLSSIGINIKPAGEIEYEIIENGEIIGCLIFKKQPTKKNLQTAVKYIKFIEGQL